MPSQTISVRYRGPTPGRPVPPSPSLFIEISNIGFYFSIQIRQSSESLTGRIAYIQLGGFRLTDIDPGAVKTLWWRGGLLPCFPAASDNESLLWLNQYVTTFYEFITIEGP